MNTSAKDLHCLLDLMARTYDPRADADIARHGLAKAVNIMAQQIIGQRHPDSMLNKLAERVLNEVMQTWPKADRQKVVFGERLTSSASQREARAALFLVLSWTSGRSVAEICRPTKYCQRVFSSRVLAGIGMAMHDLQYREKVFAIIGKLTDGSGSWRDNT
jgi:hypothetical protein